MSDVPKKLEVALELWKAFEKRPLSKDQTLALFKECYATVEEAVNAKGNQSPDIGGPEILGGDY